MLKNISIRWKILFGFGVILFLFALAGTINIFSVRKISINTEYIKNIAFTEAIYLIEVENTVKQLSSYISTSIDTGINEEFKKAQNSKLELDKKMEEAYQFFKIDSHSKQDVQKLKDSLDNYFAISNDLFHMTINQEWEKIGATINSFNKSEQDIFALISHIKSEGVWRLDNSLFEISSLTQRTVTYISAIMLITLFAAFVLAWYIAYHIVTPVEGLIGIMKKAESGDFSVRADSGRKDEMGSMANGFNEMLVHIEKRENELELHRNHLEDLVEVRTTELQKANEQLQWELREREKAEQALSESEVHLRNLLDSVHAGIMVLDAKEHKITDVNLFGAQMIGAAREDIIGRTCHKFVCVAEEGNCPITDLNQEVDNTERVLLKADMTLLPIIKSAVPITYQGRELLIESFVDISKLKKAEISLKAFTEKLEHSNKELQDFAYVASHDLQEPLRKVQVFGDRLKAKYNDTLGEKGLDYLERMQNASSRMQILINDLLTFSRVTTKAQPFAPVNLAKIAQEVVNDLEVRIEQTAGKVEIESLPTINADPLQMRQLLQNLIGNALKFHRQDTPPIVKIYSKKLKGRPGQGGMTEIVVEDNGIGFEDKYADKVFGVFQRLHGRGEYEGTGVGLAVCRKIIDRHDGKISAKSKPGEGTKFIISLPFKQI